MNNAYHYTLGGTNLACKESTLFPVQPSTAFCFCANNSQRGWTASTLFSSLIRWRGDGLSRLVAFTHCVCGFEPTVLICLERPRPARFLIIKNSLCGLLWRWLCCQKRPRTWWALVHTSDLFNSSTYLFNDVIDHNEVWSAAVSFNDDNVFSLHVPFYCDTIVVILRCGFRPWRP